MNKPLDSTIGTQEPTIGLTQWLADFDNHKEEILAGIKSGDIIATTASGFAKIREQRQQDTKRIFLLTGDLANQVADNMVLMNTIISMLLAFKGVAAKAPEILDLVKAIGIDKELTAMGFMGKLVSNPSLFQKIISGSKEVISGFDSAPLMRIDGTALVPLLSNAGFDFSEYENLIAVFGEFQKTSENG